MKREAPRVGGPFFRTQESPLPGDLGEIVSMPPPSDVRACFAVRLGRVPSHWFIPRKYLERVSASRGGRR